MATNEQDVRKVEVTMPVSLHFQLLHLAKHSPLGLTVAEVAKTLLVERVMQLMGQDFSKTIPPFERPATTPPAASNPSTGGSLGEPEPTT